MSKHKQLTIEVEDNELFNSNSLNSNNNSQSDLGIVHPSCISEVDLIDIQTLKVLIDPQNSSERNIFKRTSDYFME